jgi:hypothetical protein
LIFIAAIAPKGRPWWAPAMAAMDDTVARDGDDGIAAATEEE